MGLRIEQTSHDKSLMRFRELKRLRGRRFIYTVGTESHSPGVGIGEHAGFLRTHGADSITIGNDAGEVEIGWYEIASIGVAPD